MTLADAMARGRGNNLTTLRMALAVAVIVSHAWPMAQGPGTPEPLEALTGHSLGGWAVAGFFFLSGLLIAGSAERHGTRAFWIARARRIFPGLGVALLATLALAALSGAALTPGISATYWLRGVTLISLEHHLPGAFAASALPGVANGPLWSLFHEVAAYALCFAAVRLGLLRHGAGRLVLLTAALVLWALPDLPDRAATFAPLFLAFALGILAHVWRDRLSLSPVLTLTLLTLTPLGWPFAAAALGHALLVAAYRLDLPRWDSDLSFGTYIYGWPVAQTIAHQLPGLNAPTLALAAVLATLPFAAASWHLVERPVLTRHRERA